MHADDTPTSAPGRTGVPSHTIRAAIRAASRSGGVYIGLGEDGMVWGGPERAVLVLGPPRSGKTTSIVIPSILAAPGAVVSTSTKPDVLAATAPGRRDNGPCLLYDPSGTVAPAPGVERIRWSPISGCRRWDDALVVSYGLVGASRGTRGRSTGADHWSERAEALLATLLHAAALDGAGMPTVVGWIDRHQATAALGILDREDAGVAADLLAGIAATDGREQSGIWSTASGVLAAYRSEAALASTADPDFDADRFCDDGATLYVCATGRHQAVVAPLVVGIISDVRAAAYARSRRHPTREHAPVLLALDEVANIAPLPDLPAMVSEGGGQGLLTLACLQDLSQARQRWGAAAEGFLSLFSTTVVLPGIGDVVTLRALTDLAGDEEVVTRSVSSPGRRAAPGVAGAFAGRLLGRRGPSGRDRTVTVTTSTVRRPRLALDALSRGRAGSALVVDERNSMGWVRLTPWFADEPWRSAALDPVAGGWPLRHPSPGDPDVPRTLRRAHGRDPTRSPDHPNRRSGPDLGQSR